jgi:polysaccharide deacetylase family protein (PEP-CTERM system associated)
VESRKDETTTDLRADSMTVGDPGTEVRSHILTVVLEDYYHVAPLKSVVTTDQWYRFERRVEANTRKTLDLLDEFGVSATFFVLGSIADEMPALVREVADRGHEIASKGYVHHCIRNLTPEEFRDDVVRSRDVLERASGHTIVGFRIGHRWLAPQDLWALDVLASEGFLYDSSVRPIYWRFAGEPWRLTPHRHRHDGREIWEFPLSTWSWLRWSFPISGGNYFRQFPHWVMRRAVSSWTRTTEAPFLMYFHVWEMDPDQPRVSAAPAWERIRQYRNLPKMQQIVRYYLEHYRFMGIGDYLGVSHECRAEEQPPESEPVWTEATSPSHVTEIHEEQAPTPITVVVPCFNEELILPYLANTLNSVERDLSRRYGLSFVFVDDGSTDGTWPALNEIFGGRSNIRMTRHTSNRGVAAAVMTGIGLAETEIVCSIDCDCTYDPHQLALLIPRLEDGVDLVTASPYHPEGTVRNVPEWRLCLSKSLSSMYRVVLHHSLATYTSCFRVYRRSSVIGLELHEVGFLGVAEMLGRIDLQGGTIVEVPAVLEVRLLGRSKMKTVRTILGHLRLITKFATARLGLTSRPQRSGPGATIAESLRQPDQRERRSKQNGERVAGDSS